LSVFSARDEQQLIYHLRRALELALHGFERLPYLRLGAPVGRRPLHLGAQVRERRAQLVARVGGEGLERAMRAVHAPEHAVDAVGELADLGLTCGTPDALAELCRSDCPCLRGHELEWSQGVRHCCSCAASGVERRDRQQQGRGRRERGQRDRIGLAARDYVNVERAGRAVQHAVAPARALGDGGEQDLTHFVGGSGRRQALQAFRRHAGRHIVHLLHAPGVSSRARDDDLPAHAEELVGEHGGHHAARRAGGVGVGAEQRLDDVGRMLERAAQYSLGRDGEGHDNYRSETRQRCPGDPAEAPREDGGERSLAHGASSR
jgi:hypothetical protein